jgi:hypothetical protein
MCNQYIHILSATFEPQFLCRVNGFLNRPVIEVDHLLSPRPRGTRTKITPLLMPCCLSVVYPSIGQHNAAAIVLGGDGHVMLIADSRDSACRRCSSLCQSRRLGS